MAMQHVQRQVFDQSLGRELMAAVPYLLIYVGLAAATVGIELGGAALALPVLTLFIVLPVVDHLVGLNRHNPHPDKAPARLWLHDFLLFAYVPAQIAFFAWGIDKAVAADSWLVAAVIVADIGLVGGAFGINIAHELMHRRSGGERAMAEMLMGSVSYTWFCVEHVYGHHKRVATPEDPATSRRGESLYAFLPRTLIGGFRSFVEIERKRLRKRNGAVWSLRNRMVRYPLCIALMYAATFATWGWQGLAALVAIGAVAVLMLEIINYVEHYGLLRRRLANGRYERTQPKHSWNASHRISNYVLVNLARHSDHHAFAARPFYALRHHDDVPQMPTGYGAMFLLALVPTLWFKVMNPLVDDWNARNLG